MKFALHAYRWAKKKKLRLDMILMLLEYGVGIPMERPLIPEVQFDLNMRDKDVEISFRFNVRGVVQLTYLLGIPNVVITSNRNRVLGVEAKCITLRRLRYPVTFYDMLSTFGRSRAQLCRIFNHMINFMYSEWKETIYCNLAVVRSKIASYASAIHGKGAPLTNVWAFPDGTKIETCRIDPSSR
ncbi:hypothetical protein AeNC1_014118, partial [Aphanomyces euteiches]